MSYDITERRLQFPTGVDQQLKEHLVDEAIQAICPDYKKSCRSLRNFVLAAWNDPNAKLSAIRTKYHISAQKLRRDYYAIRKHIDEAVTKLRNHPETVSETVTQVNLNTKVLVCVRLPRVFASLPSATPLDNP